MGFFGKVKQATGIGLDGPSSYARAFEKGVLVGNYGSAAGMFRDAATKLDHDGNSGLAARAAANAGLYQFLARPTVDQLPGLRAALAKVADIEQIGSQSERIPTAPLVQEIDVRIIESQVPEAPLPEAAAGHDRAKQALEAILDRQLILYRMAPLPGEGPLVDTAVSRYYWHHGQSSHCTALIHLASNPAEAANHAVAAVQAFQQCGDTERRTAAEELARNLQVRRSCWICHREMQGVKVYIDWYPSTITAYIPTVLERASQDTGSVDVGRSMVVLCTPCAAVVEKQADRIAQARMQEVRAELTQRIDYLETWVNNLQKRSHSH